MRRDGTRLLSRTVLALAAAGAACFAGPVEFGRAELDRAIAERGLNPRLLRIKVEVAVDPPDSFRIAPGLITGGNLRGLMYGLLEAAGQIRATGRLRKASGEPALAIRGARISLKDLSPDSLNSREYWPTLFRSLARNRFNRFNLVLDAPGDDPEAVRFISQSAAEYGVDFTVGLREAGAGQPASELEPALTKLLSDCPSIRSVQLRVGDEAAMNAVRAVQDAGRRVTLEVAADATAVAAAAASAGVPLRVSAAYTDAAAPVTRHPFYWEVPQQSLHDAAAIRAVIRKLTAAGAIGFEIDLPPVDNGAEMLWGRLAYSEAN